MGIFDKLNNINSFDEDDDPVLEDAIKIVVEMGQASTSLLQRKLKLGYARAARVIDLMEQRGIVGPYEGAKPRKVLMNYNDLEKGYDHYKMEQHKKIIEECTDPKGIESILKDKFNIEPDYSNDGFFVNNLNNYLFQNADGDMQIRFVKNAVKYASPDKIRLLIIDEDFMSFGDFNSLQHLLFPVIYLDSFTKGRLSWLLDEVGRRCILFGEKSVKNIYDYNNLIKNESDAKEIPHIIVIVNEAYHLLKNHDIDDLLTNLLLKSNAVGIHFYMFTRFSQKNLPLGVKKDLLKTGNSLDLENIFKNSVKENKEVSMNYIDTKMDGYEFEKFCGDILQSNGFSGITVTQSSGDYGVDIIAYKDEIKYAIQCKKYSSPVGIDAVQQVLGSKTMYSCHVGVVLTNNYFTPAAIELASKNNVLMWDRDKLIKLIEKQ